MNPFSQLPAVKKDSKNGAARKFFGPSYFVTALVRFVLFHCIFAGSTGHVFAQQFIFYAAFHSIFNIHPDCSSAVEATSGFKLRKAGSVPRPRGTGHGDPTRGIYPGSSCSPRPPALAAAVRIFAQKTANTQYADSKFSAKRSQQQTKCYQSSVCPATATQQKWRRQWRPEVKQRRRRAGHQLGRLGTLGLRPHTSLVDGKFQAQLCF